MAEMKRLSRSVRIDAPPSAVAALLEDTDRIPEWNPMLKAVETHKEGSTAEFGTSLDWKARVAGLPLRGKSALVTKKPGREYTWINRDGYLGLRLDGDFTLEPSSNGTRLIATVSYLQPTRAPDAVYRWLARGVLGRRVETALRNIKRVVEQGR